MLSSFLKGIGKIVNSSFSFCLTSMVVKIFNACSKFGIPLPNKLSGELYWLPLFSMESMISEFLASGFACQRQATNQAIIGDENDVPRP